MQTVRLRFRVVVLLVAISFLAIVGYLSLKRPLVVETSSRKSPSGEIPFSDVYSKHPPSNTENKLHQQDALLNDIRKVLDKDHKNVREEIEKDKNDMKNELRQNLMVPVADFEPSVFGRDGSNVDKDLIEKRNTVRDMMKHAWIGYEKFAWGANELSPVSKRGHTSGIFGSDKSGASIVDGIDTLYIMGLDAQYTRARNWIATELKFAPRGEVSVFEINIRYVGGLLSAYGLTGDRMFKEKAEEIARKLFPAFNTRTGLPMSLLNINTGAKKNYPWAGGSNCILSEVGTLTLEFEYLSHITKDPTFADKTTNILDVLLQNLPSSGLYSNYINPHSGRYGRQHISLGALGDSFYEYLLKAWIQSNRTNEHLRSMYHNAAMVLKERLVHKKDGLTYLAELKENSPIHKMDHLACFSGGMFALGGYMNAHLSKELNDEFINLGAEITNTCHESYIRTASKIGPDIFHFDRSHVATASRSNEMVYLQRPETVESFFVLWRITKDPKYREWGWNVVQAIEKHCKKENGYVGLRNVNDAKPGTDDVQQSYFLAETLKYLYLLFSDDNLLPLTKFTFNTEAHPLPIFSKSSS